MKISIAFDHGALSLRAPVMEIITELGHELIDHGTDSTESVDYPDFARLVTNDIASKHADLGVLCCTTGIGMSIAANKVKGVRAAVLSHEDEAALTRQHNHANVICLGAMHTTPYEAKRLVKIFIESIPEGGRHERRVSKFTDWESNS